jgi:excisionase family DNA binding protein
MSGTDDAIDGAPYTMAEAMAMLNCSEDAVVARINAGELAATKPGRGWIFPRAAFHESLNEIARAEAATRRAEHSARNQAKTVLKKVATRPSRVRGRTPPALPSVP